MHNWKYPDVKTDNIDFAEVTDETLAEWEKIYDDSNDHNKALKERLFLLKNEAIGIAIGVWGENSNVVKYLKKQKIYSPSTFVFNDLQRQVADAKKKKKKDNRDAQALNDREQLTEKAINWLTDREKTLGVDFTIHSAISVANVIAFDEEITKRINEIKLSGNLIGFYGDNNCEDCGGWNGQSRRCECSTRRVGWSNHENEDFFLEPYIFCEAY